VIGRGLARAGLNVAGLRVAGLRVAGLRVASLGLAAALTLAVSACARGGDDSGRGAEWVAPAGASEEVSAELAGAATALGKESFKIQLDMGEAADMTGAMDAPNKRGRLTVVAGAEGSTMTIQTLVVGKDLYVKMRVNGEPLPGAGTKWMHMDATRLPQKNSLGVQAGEFDPAGAAKFLNSVSTAEKVDDHTYSGTLDLTKASGGGVVDDKDLGQLGDKARSVPFEATTDDQGRLVKLAVDIPALEGQPARTMTVTYSDFGTKVAVKKPPARNVREAPDMVYGTLGA
jgi:hypothetical protein